MDALWRILNGGSTKTERYFGDFSLDPLKYFLGSVPKNRTIRRLVVLVMFVKFKNSMSYLVA